MTDLSWALPLPVIIPLLSAGLALTLWRHARAQVVISVTALTLIAHMPELGHRSPKSIAALAGLAPIDNESGKQKRRSSIAPGRSRVRRALYMAALASIKACSRFKADYDAIAARSGAKKIAIIAVARKILVSLNAMIRDRKRFA